MKHSQATSLYAMEYDKLRGSRAFVGLVGRFVGPEKKFVGRFVCPEKKFVGPIKMFVGRFVGPKKKVPE